MMNLPYIYIYIYIYIGRERERERDTQTREPFQKIKTRGGRRLYSVLELELAFHGPGPALIKFGLKVLVGPIKFRALNKIPLYHS